MDLLSGMTVVFTGKMNRSRAAMEQEATLLGANVEPRVTSRTDWLVTGKRVGRTKINKAIEVGCRQLTEAQYRQEITTRGAKAVQPAEKAEQEQSAKRTRKRKKKSKKPPAWVKDLRSEKSIRF